MAQSYVGEIRMFGGNFAPAGWAFCNGAQVPISENETLFSLIGTTYGGDGQETFNLPDLQGRAPVHMGTNRQTGTTYIIGERSGAESVTLVQQTTPLHNHALLASTTSAAGNTPANSVTGESTTINVYLEDTPAGALFNGSLQQIGGSQPHDNLQPFLVVSFIISLFGIYPTQS